MRVFFGGVGSGIELEESCASTLSEMYEANASSRFDAQAMQEN